MRSVDELAAADVDADVAGACEEDEVAGLELADRYRRAHRKLRVRAVRHRDADLREGVHDKAGAIETAWRRATPHVRHAEVAHRDPDHAAVDVRRRDGRAL